MLLLVVNLVILSGCPRRPGPDELALVDGEAITATDLRERFREGPAEVRRAAMKRGGRHYLLDQTIDSHLLLREARRRNLRPSFAMIEEAHRPQAKRFLDAEFERTVSADDIPEAEVRAEFERLSDEIQHPGSLRVELAFCETRERAEALLETARAALDRNDQAEVQRIIRNDGDPGPAGGPDRYRGDFSHGQLGSYFGIDVERAAFSLDEDEYLYGEPVAYLGGFAILLVPMRTQPQVTPYEEAAGQLRARLFDSHRERALDAFVDRFRPDHEVQVFEDLFEHVPWQGREREIPEPPDGDNPLEQPQVPETPPEQGDTPRADAAPEAARDGSTRLTEG